jgi:hypothetical protein
MRRISWSALVMAGAVFAVVPTSTASAQVFFGPRVGVGVGFGGGWGRGWGPGFNRGWGGPGFGVAATVPLGRRSFVTVGSVAPAANYVAPRYHVAPAVYYAPAPVVYHQPVIYRPAPVVIHQRRWRGW